MLNRQSKLLPAAVFAFLMTALAFLPDAAFAQTDETRLLPPNQTIEREMTGAQTHRYKFDLKQNEFFQIRVEQKGVDVALKIKDADGKTLATMDSPNGKEGFETLSFISDKAGSFILEVGGFDAKAEKGIYIIKREASRTAVANDKRRVEVEKSFVEGMKARDAEGQSEIAVKKLEEALTGWRNLKDEYLGELTARQVNQLKQTKANAIFEEASGLFRQGTAESYNAALNKFQEANRLYQEIYDKSENAGLSLLMSGLISNKLGEKPDALKFYEKALSFFRVIENKKWEATTLNNIGSVYSSLGENQKALEYYNQSLPLLRQVGDKSGEATTLNNIGSVYDNLGENQKALEYYNQSLPLKRQVGDKSGEATTLSNIMYAWESLKNPRFAVFYGKQSVNLFQELRQNINSLDREIQKTYLKSIEGTYRHLSDILIAQGRIAEAEQVLKMLKEEEYLSYLRRDDKVARDLLQTVSLTDKEREALKRYDELAGKITAAGKEFGELDAERKNYDEGQFLKQARYDELKKQLADATTAFQKFLDELKTTFGQKDERVVSVDSSLQNTLKRLKASRTAIVSTIVGENRLNLIVTTADTQRAHTIDISEKDINSLVTDFRQALTNPKIDPRPSGQKLYDVLVKPIEADLAGIEADTILWSLDGTLRYIPTAALWDKQKGYIAERFASAVLTLASRDTLALPVSDKRSWNALGVGVSKPTEGFSALIAVPDELDCIITDIAAKTVSLKPVCQSGVMTGKKLLDEKFTLSAFENSLGRFSIIHIASHFSLNPGNDKDSFLLLGGEQKRFTVENLRGISLTDVELIVLSACNTATPGGEKANGVEIEGFGAVAQKQGAKAVMATLWSVADDSTRDLMVNFYGQYEKNNLTKAEAIRQAQLAMIYGKYKPSDGNTKRGAEIINLSGDNKPQIPFKTDDNAPYSHPFYWSPFVMYGNWR